MKGVMDKRIRSIEEDNGKGGSDNNKEKNKH